MITKEVWKDVKNFDGVYQVSNLGRVKSLSRPVINNNGVGYRTIKERILKPLDNKGYTQVYLFIGGKRSKFTIHQLVAIAFLNHTPCGHKLVVNHINFIKTDNRVENLEIVTARVNCNKKHFNNTSKYTGVSWVKRDSKWTAQIFVNNKQTNLGSFDSEIEAHNAYQNKLLTLLQIG